MWKIAWYVLTRLVICLIRLPDFCHRDDNNEETRTIPSVLPCNIVQIHEQEFEDFIKPFMKKICKSLPKPKIKKIEGQQHDFRKAYNKEVQFK